MTKGNRYTVLIVNDMELTRAVFRKMCEEVYNSIEAADGNEALAILNNTNVDLVLLDIDMPVMNGYQVIQKMKMNPRLADIPIVVTTGAVDKSERRAFELGADDFIAQPYDPYITRKRVDNLINKYVMQVELYKNKAQEAEKENKAKTDFLSRISHDIRTPLNGILGLANLLKKDIDRSNISALEDVQQLELSGYYLLNLINDTLDVSKIESGKLELHPTVCNVKSVIANVVSLIRPNIEAKHLHLHVNDETIAEEMLYADVGRIEQVLMNILGNAVKFTPEGGNVDFDLSVAAMTEEKITYKAKIHDSGVGISEEFLAHIFEPFTQEASEIRAELQGSGLGMTITKELIELMGGRIEVESTKGKGTTFTLEAPLHLATKEQVDNWKATKTEAVLDISLKGKHILLCEDNQVNALIATRLLTTKGVIVDRAENGKEGIDKFIASAPNYYDLILMDIRMPVMDGIQATRELRHLNRADAQRVPIVAMTANAFADDIEQVKSAGMNGHIAKPLIVETFFNTLEQLLDIAKCTKRQSVLVVDDVAVNRAVVKESLLEDFVVLEASSGEGALAILKERPDIDILITDIQMPCMSGTDLIREVRSNPMYKHLIIIANTQFGDPEQEEELLKLGADDFVYKPTTPKIVEIRVRNALRKL